MQVNRAAGHRTWTPYLDNDYMESRRHKKGRLRHPGMGAQAAPVR
jgi:hypothetical protein